MSALAMARRLLFGAAVLAPTLALAQPPDAPGDGPPPAQGRRGVPGGGPSEDGPRPPLSPIMAALDTNHDGELSPEEIRNAATALKSLDHNHDGILDRAELDPRGGGPDGPDGPADGPPRGGRRGGPPGGGPDGAADGPLRGGRFGGPPPDGPDGPMDGPPGGGRPPGAGRGRPQIGHVLPPFVREQLSLTERQVKQIAELENVVKGKLEAILSADSSVRCESSSTAARVGQAAVRAGAVPEDLRGTALPTARMTDLRSAPNALADHSQPQRPRPTAGWPTRAAPG